MKILKHEEPSGQEYRMSVMFCKKGTKEPAETFRTVKLHMEDGTITGGWKSNKRRGYFRQVFVPWDFEHPKIIRG